MAMPNLDILADAGLPRMAATSAGLGILTHLVVIRNLEVEKHLRFALTAIALLIPLSIQQYSAFSHVSLWTASASVATILGSFVSGLGISVVVYRLFFHPLGRFPGPVLARLTKLYGTWLAGKESMYHKELKAMHDKYGDFVRTGPRELSIRRQSAIDIIYGPRTKCSKSTWYDQVSTNDTKSSVHMTRDKALHKRRRKAWDRAFTPRALDAYLPHIINKVDGFTTMLSSLSANDPLEITQWTMLFSFDIMGLVGLGRDFHGIPTGTLHPAIGALREHMRMLGILSHVPWLLNLLALVPGASGAYAPFFTFCAEQVREKRERMLAENKNKKLRGEVGGSMEETRMAVPDIMTWLISAYDDPADPLGVPSRAALDEDSRVVIIAGSETTATTLATVLYFMAKLPKEQRKFQAILDKEIGEDWTYEKAKACSYLDWVITETLRLQPAVRTGAPMETPPEGITVDGVYIPGNVNVLVGPMVIQNDTRYWGDRAGEFDPSRHGEKSSHGAPFMAFGMGQNQCPGKTLAYVSLRCSISKILLNFDVSFAPGEDGVAFEAGALDTFTTYLPPCNLVFSKRNTS